MIYMKYAHSVKTRVILPKDEEGTGKRMLISLFSDTPKQFLEDEEPSIESSYAQGLNNENIVVLEWTCSTTRHINTFIQRFVSRIPDEKLRMLSEQEDRLDDDLNFYIRLDKDSFENGEWVVTQSGKCIHIRIHIAAYPAKKKTALEKIEALFKDKAL